MTPPREMTRDDLYEFVLMLDAPLPMIFDKAEAVAREAEATPLMMSLEYQIAKAIFDVFDSFAQRWFDEQYNQEE